MKYMNCDSSIYRVFHNWSVGDSVGILSKNIDTKVLSPTIVELWWFPRACMEELSRVLIR
jgi:hypothetical protein